MFREVNRSRMSRTGSFGSVDSPWMVFPFATLPAWRPSECSQHSQVPEPGPRPHYSRERKYVSEPRFAVLRFPECYIEVIVNLDIRANAVSRLAAYFSLKYYLLRSDERIGWLSQGRRVIPDGGPLFPPTPLRRLTTPCTPCACVREPLRCSAAGMTRPMEGGISHLSVSSLMVSPSAGLTTWIGVLLRLEEDIFTDRPVKLLIRSPTQTHLIYKAKNCDGLEEGECWPSKFGGLFMGYKGFTWDETALTYMGEKGTEEWKHSCFDGSAREYETGIVVEEDPSRQPNLTACARSIAELMKNHFEVFKYMGHSEEELFIGAVNDLLLAREPPRPLERFPLSRWKDTAEQGTSRSKLSEHVFIRSSLSSLTIISLTARIRFQCARNLLDWLASTMLSWSMFSKRTLKRLSCL